MDAPAFEDSNESHDETTNQEDPYESDSEEDEDDEEAGDVPEGRFANLRHSLRKASPQAKAGNASKMTQVRRACQLACELELFSLKLLHKLFRVVCL